MKRNSSLFKGALMILVLAILSTVMFGCAGSTTTSTAATTTAKAAQSSATSAASAAATTAKAAAPSTVKIAAFYNMSGISGDAGALSKKGYELAIKQINDAGGIKSLNGAKLEVVVGDTMSDTTQAKAVAERVLADNAIVAAFGVGASAQGLPMLPVFQKLNVAFTHNGIGDSFTTQGYDIVFQHVSRGAAWGVAQVDFLKWMNANSGLNITKVGLCYENTENGQSNAKSAKASIEQAGGSLKLVADETFTAGLSDAAPIVTRLKQSGAQIIFMNGFTQDVKLITSAMKTMSYDPIIFGSGAAVSFPVFAKEMGDSVNGILLMGGIPWDNPVVKGDPMTAAAPDLFKQMYGGEFFSEASCGAYMGVRILAAAIEAAGSTDREAVKKAMRNVNILSFEGGAIKFDETGKNTNAKAFVSQWQKDPDGKYTLHCVWPTEYAGAKFQVPLQATK